MNYKAITGADPEKWKPDFGNDHGPGVESASSMTVRTSSKTVTFARPFWLKGIDRELAAGSYWVLTDEESVEQLSFPVYRRVSTMIFVPAPVSSVEMVSIDPLDLQAAQD